MTTYSIEKRASSCLAPDKNEGAAHKDEKHSFEPHVEILLRRRGWLVVVEQIMG